MDHLSYQKLEAIAQRVANLESLLSDSMQPFDAQKHQQWREEHAALQKIHRLFKQWKRVKQEAAEIELLLSEPDLSIAEMAMEEKTSLAAELIALSYEIQLALLPEEREASQPFFLEIRAGTGGEEAALFASDLFRAYALYIQSQGWKGSIQHRHLSEAGGLREVCMRVEGSGSYGALRHESGGHRVQRVPATESQGRIHTSACMVLVTPETPKQERPELKSSDLRVDTFRASGAGGQHVNKTDSAVRITHLPTGLVVTCQDGRSQHQNRESAMTRLLSKLTNLRKEEAKAKEMDIRSTLLSSGCRTDRIRTYNFPQGRVTDHRIGLTLYQLEAVLAGQLGLLLNPLHQAYQNQRLEQAKITPLKL